MALEMEGEKTIPPLCQAFWDKARALGRGRFTAKLMKEKPQATPLHGLATNFVLFFFKRVP